MHDFDELLKICRRRRLKRWAMAIVAAGIAVGMVAGIQWYADMQSEGVFRFGKPVLFEKIGLKDSSSLLLKKSAEKEGKISPKASSLDTVKQVTGENNVTKNIRNDKKESVTYRVLQFATLMHRFEHVAIERKRELEKFGLRCYLKASEEKRHLYLRCLPPENLQDIGSTLRQKGWRYFFVTEKGEKYPNSYQVSLATPHRRLNTFAKKKRLEVSKKEASSKRVKSFSPVDIVKKREKKLKVEEIENLTILQSRFQRYPSYETALHISKILYRRKKYLEAAGWARKANLIDREKEEAWILFAKAKYAAGEKERAKRILRVFLDYKLSDDAKHLLDEWSRP